MPPNGETKNEKLGKQTQSKPPRSQNLFFYRTCQNSHDAAAKRNEFVFEFEKYTDRVKIYLQFITILFGCLIGWWSFFRGGSRGGLGG